jgi:uncharacterized protein YegL
MSLLDAYALIESRPLPVVLLLDTSASMGVDDKIEVLNAGVAEMLEELIDADGGNGFIQLSLITFGGDRAEIVCAHNPVSEVPFQPLRANGRTPLGQAFQLARSIIEDREALPSRAYRPTIALISDGIPTDRDWEEHLEELISSERGAKATRFALGIGADADYQMLARFSGDEVHAASEAAQIRRFLQFVTTTITQVTMTAHADDPPEPSQDAHDSIVRLQSPDAF